jgi:hypothetical protein
LGVLVPAEAIFLMVWWLVSAWKDDPENWLAPLRSYNVGTVLFQWALAFVVLLLANRWLRKGLRPVEELP